MVFGRMDGELVVTNRVQMGNYKKIDCRSTANEEGGCKEGKVNEYFTRPYGGSGKK